MHDSVEFASLVFISISQKKGGAALTEEEYAKEVIINYFKYQAIS